MKSLSSQDISFKISFLVNDFKPPLLDGNQTSIRGWMLGLQKRGVKVDVLTPANPKTHINKDGLTVHDSPGPSSPRGFFLRLTRFLGDIRPDIMVIRSVSTPGLKHYLFYTLTGLICRVYGCVPVISPWGGPLRNYRLLRKLLFRFASPVSNIVVPGCQIEGNTTGSVRERSIDFAFISGVSSFDEYSKEYLMKERGLGFFLEFIRYFHSYFNKKLNVLVAVPALMSEDGRIWFEKHLKSMNITANIQVEGKLADTKRIFEDTRFLFHPHNLDDRLWYPHAAVEAMSCGCIPVLPRKKTSVFLAGSGAIITGLEQKERLASLVSGLLLDETGFEKRSFRCRNHVIQRYSVEAAASDVYMLFEGFLKERASGKNV